MLTTKRTEVTSVAEGEHAAVWSDKPRAVGGGMGGDAYGMHRRQRNGKLDRAVRGDQRRFLAGRRYRLDTGRYE